MLTRETKTSFFANAWNKTKDVFSNGAWLGASLPGETPSEIPPTTSYTTHRSVEKWKVGLNKWISETMSKIGLPLLTVWSFLQVHAALTQSTLGSNFEIQTAPNLPIALTLGALGIISGFLSVAAHKDAANWRAVEQWMGRQELTHVDIHHVPYYRDSHIV